MSDLPPTSHDAIDPNLTSQPHVEPPAGYQPQTSYPSYPPAPPYPPPGTQYPYPGAYAPQASVPVAPARPKRALLWWLLGLGVVVAVIGSCAWLGTLGARSNLSAGGNNIAVIPIDGVIAGSGSGGVITPQAFRTKLNQALADSSVRAIVLRVDSPGGTVAASEEIALYVKAAKKPVVVSTGDVNASGAYMVSSQADRILALPGSAVGSIGVIIEIPNVAGLMDKLGVKFSVITAGKYKGAGSPYRALTPTETALIQGSVDEAYGQFVDIVAEGRKMQRSEVESLATGWAWNGSEAKKLGLIDEIGTFDDALKSAAKLGGIKGKYNTIDYDEPQLSDLFGSVIGLTRQLGDNAALGQRGVLAPGPALAK